MDRLETIVRAIPDLVFRFDDQGKFLDFYVTKSELLAVPPDQIIGRNLKDLFQPHVVKKALSCITKSLVNKIETRFEYELELRVLRP